MSPQHSSAGAAHAAPLADLARAAEAFMPTGDIVYLNCAAQAPRLRTVHAAGAAALEAGWSPWEPATASPAESTERLRAQVAQLFDGDADALACIPSASYGLATAARNLPLGAGDGVLVLDGQFPSNLLPWQQRCEETGARLIGVQRAPGMDWTQAVLNALQQHDGVRVVALPQVRWDDGALLDLDRIAARAHDAGAALVLDLSQSLGVLATDLARWRPAVAVWVGDKWLFGPLGLGWVWAAP
ncbi:MAG: aminotransferase class V-fold PLP-dependent enzyme, partial [Arenimonas sp.]|uniref:aminotransferase class V-fold PLP-dependent enzyme n=1 Tax=Arenimonas sp. TaxID=1872635 RepID=UPI0025BEFA17